MCSARSREGCEEMRREGCLRWEKELGSRGRDADWIGLNSFCRDLVNASLRNLGKAPGGEYRTPPLVSRASEIATGFR